MTVEDQLREFARHADQHQRVITADEIVQAARHDVTPLAEHSRSEDGSESTRPRPPDDLAAERRPWRQWALVAAAGTVVVALGLFAADARDKREDVRTDTVLPTPAPFTDIPPGSIAFAADSAGGEALTERLTHGAVESRPSGMDIYIVRDGDPVRRVTSSGTHDRCPAFSPDGQRLAYLEMPAAIRGPSIVVERLDAAGDSSDAQVLAFLPESGYGLRSFEVPCPQWSPDGSQIAFLAYLASGTEGELRVADLDGPERVLDSGGIVHPGPFAWSPDGDTIAYGTDDGVWAAPLDGSAPTLLWPTEGTPTAVSWSSRGELAVTVLTTVAVEGGSSAVSSVYVVDVDAGSERLVDVTIPWSDYAAAWSPDGSRLAFVGDDGQIRMNDRDDGSTDRLSPRADGLELRFKSVTWSPDGEQLLGLATSDDDGYALISLSADGASVEVLTPWTWAFDWTNLRDVSWRPSTK